jgi:hypothetical protein
MCSSNAGNPYGGIAQAGANQGAGQPRSKTPTVTLFNRFKYTKALEGYKDTARDMGNTWDMQFADSNAQFASRPGETWAQATARRAQEKAAFESSAAYRAEEGGVEYSNRLGREKNAYVANWISLNENLDPATGEAWTDHGYGIPPPQPASSGGSSGGGAPGAPGAPAAPTGPKDVMAARNKQKKAQRAGQSTRGRTSLRI